MIAHECGRTTEAGTWPFTDIAVSFTENTLTGGRDRGDVSAEPIVRATAPQAKAPLFVELEHSPDGLRGVAEFRPGMYPRTRVRAILDAWERSVKQTMMSILSEKRNQRP